MSNTPRADKIARRGPEHSTFVEWAAALLELARTLERELDRAGAEVLRLHTENQARQAKIDALMLEYCPDEMTPEQLEEWGRHQSAVPARSVE